MSADKASLRADAVRFARAAISSRDLDPTYPVLRAIQAERELDREQALWSSVLFVGWYRLASSLQVVPWHPSMPSERMRYLGTGVERRGLRTPDAMQRHWRSVLDLVDEHGSVEAWLTAGFSRDGGPRLSAGTNWNRVRSNYERAWGNGRWATYKLAEVLREVNGFDIDPPDMGNDGSTGPVAGIHMLYGQPPADLRKADRIRWYDQIGTMLQLQLQLGEVTTNLAQVETILCDFHSMAHGGYYVGHDIDLMQQDLRRPEVPAAVAAEVFRARKAVLPHAYLGELRGWVGVDRARRKAYIQTGRVLTR